MTAVDARPFPLPPPSPAPALLRPLAPVLSTAYGFGVAVRNRLYDRRRGRRLPVPVVSVGNVAAGGTGKSPMVAWICERLIEAGHRPVIGMRGYRAEQTGGSDEAREHQRRVPGAAVVAHPKRYEAIAAYLRGHPDRDCVVLDDGFQHRRLDRDLDLVLISARRPPFADRLLPWGYLREPVSSLARADAVIVTHAPEDEHRRRMLAEAVARCHGREPIAWARHEWTAVHVDDRAEPLDFLSGRHVMAVCGIANPEAFFDQLVQVGAEIVAAEPRPDHARYTKASMRKLLDRSRRAEADLIVTTEKDWVKMERAMPADSAAPTVVRPVLGLRFLSGEDELKRLMLESVNP